MSRYGLPPGYRSQAPASYAPAPGGPLWQPDVYPLAADIARACGAHGIIDVGCSTGSKLLALWPEFWLVGLDLPGAHGTDERASWIPHDLDSPAPLPVPSGPLADAVLVCADVIEHMAEPERLVGALRAALEHAHALVLSTPDRDRVRGPEDLGPPANHCHAREWTAAELVGWLSSEGLEIDRQIWQRSNDRTDRLDTTVLIIAGARGLPA